MQVDVRSVDLLVAIWDLIDGKGVVEGILTALETSHAVAHLKHMEEDVILLILSGRGDKDLDHVMTWLKDRS